VLTVGKVKLIMSDNDRLKRRLHVWCHFKLCRSWYCVFCVTFLFFIYLF